MNYEEKYKQAVEAAKRELHCCGSLDCDAARQIFRLFPELRESEDEKIRKEIIQSIKDSMCVIHKDKCLAWLEKQGEQKSSWSEEDENNIKCICSYLELHLNYVADINEIEECKYLKDWLKSIKPNHWKPTKEQMEALTIAVHDSHEHCYYKNLYSLYNGLKSLQS